MKKTNNKGFSLVELIIVIAIMAVLVTVLAPQFLRYVEKSRVQKDNSAIGEINSAIEVAVSDETIATSVTTSETFEATSNVFTFSASGSALAQELNKTIGGTVALTSNSYKNDTTKPSVTVTRTTDGFTVSSNNLN